jgi:L,D-transpeptidase catalytic domain/Putative peptidoglycan binding domain
MIPAAMRRRRLLVLPLAAAVVAAPPAAAQLPVPTTPAPTPAPKPKPKAKPGKMSIRLAGGIATKRLRYVVRGQRVRVSGTVRPFVSGQVVTVMVVRKGKVTVRKRARVRRARRGRGRFVVRFVARRRGLLRVVAIHRATPSQVGFRARSKRVRAVLWSAGRGGGGLRVLLLQRGLRSLGYAVPVTGRYDGGTARAVTAFRKVQGWARTGHASTAVYGKVFRRRGRFRLRHPRAGRHVEFDWSRQVLVLANRGRAWRTYHASSGKASTPTVFGTYRFYSKTPGTNNVGMVDSNYFIGGYAIHGYPSVPTYPASHGCIRIPIPNARDVYNWIPLGMRIFVYR